MGKTKVISKTSKKDEPIRQKLKTKKVIKARQNGKIRAKNLSLRQKNELLLKRKHLSQQKNQKKKSKDLEKSRSNYQEEEDKIHYIENERKLMEEDGKVEFYKIKKEEELIDEEKDEWSVGDDENIPSVSLNDLIKSQMDSINDHALEPAAVQGFKEMAILLRNYSSGKLPKLFNLLPSLEDWNKYILFTNPQSWSPQAMYEATVMFSSNLNAPLAEKFYSDFLLPSIRQNIRKFNKLNIHLYNAIKKSIFKPSAFFKGIIFPIAEKLTSKEANIIGSILRKCSIPIVHSSSAIMKLIELNGDRISHGHFFLIKILLAKKYSLPTPVKNALVVFFVGFATNPKYSSSSHMTYRAQKKLVKSNALPVIWHQTLLVFVQIYKFDLTDEERKNIRQLIGIHSHHVISDLVVRELNFGGFK